MINLYPLGQRVWEHFQVVANQSFVVQASIPILYFGNYKAYCQSRIKVVTVGLNPSRKEFPSDESPRFLTSDGLDLEQYFQSLNNYFCLPPDGNPYRKWFNSFEPLLKGLGTSYYGNSKNIALHTDFCSPIATDPTWSRLDSEQQTLLLNTGKQLWLDLIAELRPDVILMSVRRKYLSDIAPDYTLLHTVAGKNYHFWQHELNLLDSLKVFIVFGQAMQTPFGKLSNIEKIQAGQAIAQKTLAKQ